MKQLSLILLFIFLSKSLTALQNDFGNFNSQKISHTNLTNVNFKSEVVNTNLTSEQKINLWKKDSFFRGANIHPYKHFSPFSMRDPITREDLKELKKLGANIIVANFPGVFTYYPPYEIDSLHLKNLDRIVELTSELKFYLVISFRSGPGRSLYTFYDKKREDEFLLYDSIARSKYLDMCRFIAERYKRYNNLVGINFLLEPHSDDPVNLQPIDDSIYFQFVEDLIFKIREVDENLPIIVQPLSWAYPHKFSSLKKFNDEKIVYSFNMYFPHTFTNERNDSSYPGFYFVNDSLAFVDSVYLKKFLDAVRKFKVENDVPIFVNEYGGIRFKKGFLNYIKDLHNIFIDDGFHFAFYVWKSEWGEIDGNTFDEFNYEKGSSNESKSKMPNELIKEFERVWKLKR